MIADALPHIPGNNPMVPDDPDFDEEAALSDYSECSMMAPFDREDDTRDKVIRVATRLDQMATEMAEMKGQLQQLLTYAEQAKGAKWALGGISLLFGLGGGVASGRVASFMQNMLK